MDMSFVLVNPPESPQLTPRQEAVREYRKCRDVALECGLSQSTGVMDICTDTAPTDAINVARAHIQYMTSRAQSKAQYDRLVTAAGKTVTRAAEMTNDVFLGEVALAWPWPLPSRNDDTNE